MKGRQWEGMKDEEEGKEGREGRENSEGWCSQTKILATPLALMNKARLFFLKPTRSAHLVVCRQLPMDKSSSQQLVQP
jgi:hypothetical protein